MSPNLSCPSNCPQCPVDPSSPPSPPPPLTMTITSPFQGSPPPPIERHFFKVTCCAKFLLYILAVGTIWQPNPRWLRQDAPLGRRCARTNSRSSGTTWRKAWASATSFSQPSSPSAATLGQSASTLTASPRALGCSLPSLWYSWTRALRWGHSMICFWWTRLNVDQRVLCVRNPPQPCLSHAIILLQEKASWSFHRMATSRTIAWIFNEIS